MKKIIKIKYLLMSLFLASALVTVSGQEEYEDPFSSEMGSSDGTLGTATLPTNDDWEALEGSAKYGVPGVSWFGEGEDESGLPGGPPIGGATPIGELPILSLVLIAGAYGFYRKRKTVKVNA